MNGLAVRRKKSELGCRGSRLTRELRDEIEEQRGQAANSLAQEVENIVADPWRHLRRIEGATGLDGFFIGIQKTDTVRIQVQVPLEVPLNSRTKLIVYIAEDQISHLFAGFIIKRMRNVYCFWHL